MRPAEVLAVLHEERVERDPVRRVDRLAEGGFGLLGGLRTDHTEPVRDPVDVRVDGDRGDPVAEDEDAVRCLRSDTGQGGQFVERPGHLAAETTQDLESAGPDHARLDPVETGRADQRLERRGGRPREGGSVREPGEELRARDVRVRVAGPLREDRPDEDLERVLGVVPQIRSPPVPGPVELGEPVEDRLPVGRAEPRRGPHAAGPGRRDLPAPESAAGPSAARSSPGSERSGSSSPSFSLRSSPTR
jgi:hypothetical protein